MGNGPFFSRLALIAAAVLLARPVAAQVPAIDWKAQQAEILRYHRGLIQIDTSNPPGNETRAVEYLQKVFQAENIPTQVFALEPSRANLVARLKGNGSKRPVLLMAHTDVVGVQREKWPVDPFGAVLKDGYVWGRGSFDDKDKLAANLMVILLLKRSSAKLDRDVIFLAEPGEEGTTKPGIEFMVNQHLDEINAEYALTEGGSANLENGRVMSVGIQTTEKLPRSVRLIADGTSGHASIPRVDNAIVHLATAVGKVGTWETPMRLNETTRTYFEKLASVSSPEKAARYRALSDPARTEEIQHYLAVNEPEHYSMLRTSVVPTILKGGFRVNVIPSEAEATVDIRALPDEDMPEFLSAMGHVINDPAVKIETIPENIRPAGKPSRLDSEMYRALQDAARKTYPGSTVMPVMSTGATDMAYLRAKGIECFGIGSPATENDRNNFGAHSDVERVLETSVYSLTEFTWDAVTEVAVGK